TGISGGRPALLCPNRHRNRKEEGTAVFERAFDPDAPAVRFDDALDDRKPEPGPSTFGFVRLPEPIEKMRKVFGGNACPGIRDREQYFFIAPSRSQRDEPSGRGELEGVTEEVVEDLEQSLAIGEHIGKVLCQFDLNVEGRRRGR